MGYWEKRSEKENKAANKDKMTAADFEKQAEEILEENANYLSRKIKEQTDRMNTVTSNGYWFCVYFNNDQQKKEFLRKLGMCETDMYINGRDFAKRIGQRIEKPDFDFGEEKKPVTEFQKRARPVKEQ